MAPESLDCACAASGATTCPLLLSQQDTRPVDFLFRRSHVQTHVRELPLTTANTLHLHRALTHKRYWDNRETIPDRPQHGSVCHERRREGAGGGGGQRRPAEWEHSNGDGDTGTNRASTQGDRTGGGSPRESRKFQPGETVEARGTLETQLHAHGSLNFKQLAKEMASYLAEDFKQAVADMIQSTTKELQSKMTHQEQKLQEAKQRISQAEDKAIQLEKQVSDLKKQASYTVDKLEDLENRSRRSNLKMIGIGIFTRPGQYQTELCMFKEDYRTAGGEIPLLLFLFFFFFSHLISFHRFCWTEWRIWGADLIGLQADHTG
ncbi:peroxisomal biogenesis factor 7 isoform X3 [Dendrobates tinctorius]|uniref:peroxisomal biogenesis factor 7 isoform X3 n=1 Tax=Dendrobates tinctorius TaxID=92724 RepID=UPI003CC92364